MRTNVWLWPLIVALMIVSAARVNAVGEEAPIVTGEDTAFLVQAARFGLATIAASEATLAKSVREEVKEFSRVLIQERGKVNEDLMALFKLKRLLYPPATPPTEGNKSEGLEEVVPTEKADQAFLAVIIRMHEQMLKTCETAAKQCKDAEVLTFVALSSPMLRNHLEKAKELAAARIWVPAAKVALPPVERTTPPREDEPIIKPPPDASPPAPKKDSLIKLSFVS